MPSIDGFLEVADWIVGVDFIKHISLDALVGIIIFGK